VTPVRVLAELEILAARLGIEVRVEPFDHDICSTRGGLCLVQGRPLLLMDEGLPIEDRIDVMAGAVAHFDLEGVYIPPIVRDRIEAARVDGIFA
jgi:hypothetical protein